MIIVFPIENLSNGHEINSESNASSTINLEQSETEIDSIENSYDVVDDVKSDM